MSLRPNFFIVGAPKAGTTALHTYLDTHPEVCMSKEKEPNYFSQSELNHQQLYYNKPNVESESDYLALFQCNDNAKAVGEASVSYLFYPEVAKRIYNFNSEAKIIISLREPVSRAFSHYQMDYSLGLIDVPFDDIVNAGPNDAQLGQFYQQYILLSNYYEQVKRYIDTFKSQNVMVILQKDLINTPESVLHNVCQFLSINPILRSSSFENQNVTSAGKNMLIRGLYTQSIIRKTSQWLMSERLRKRIKTVLFSREALPKITPETIKILKKYFDSDVTKTATLIARDLSSWKN